MSVSSEPERFLFPHEQRPPMLRFGRTRRWADLSMDYCDNLALRFGCRVINTATTSNRVPPRMIVLPHLGDRALWYWMGVPHYASIIRFGIQVVQAGHFWCAGDEEDVRTMLLVSLQGEEYLRTRSLQSLWWWAWHLAPDAEREEFEAELRQLGVEPDLALLG